MKCTGYGKCDSIPDNPCCMEIHPYSGVCDTTCIIIKRRPSTCIELSTIDIADKILNGSVV